MNRYYILPKDPMLLDRCKETLWFIHDYPGKKFQINISNLVLNFKFEIIQGLLLSASGEVIDGFSLVPLDNSFPMYKGKSVKEWLLSIGHTINKDYSS